MKYLVPLLLAAAFCTYGAAIDSAKLSGTLSTVDLDAQADLDDLQTTTFDTSDGQLYVQKDYLWDDGSILYDYYMHMELEAGGNKDWFTVADTNNNGGSGTLQQLISNGKWFRKNYSVRIYAYTKNITLSGQDSDDDTISIRLDNSSFVFDTKTDVSSPYCGIYKWHTVTVNGTAFAEAAYPGGNWETVKYGTDIEVSYINGSHNDSKTVETGSGSNKGRFSAVFSCPTTGWDEDASWRVTAKLLADQATDYGYDTTYKESQDVDYINVYTTLDALKAAMNAWFGSLEGVVVNIRDSVESTETTIAGFDSSGASTGGTTISIDPAGSLAVDLGVFSGGTGSVEIYQGGVLGAFVNSLKMAGVGSGGYYNSLRTATVKWGALPSGNSRSNMVCANDPSAGPVNVTATVYNDSGTPLGSEVFTVNPHGNVSIELPGDIPGLPASGTGSVVLEGDTGEEVLYGGMTVENLDTGATSFCEMSGGGWTTLSAPLVEYTGTRDTTITVQNPTATPAEVYVGFFDEMGTPVVDEPWTMINPHGRLSVAASSYVAVPWRGSVRVELLAGEVISGNVTYSDDQETETATMPLLGEDARRLISPMIPGTDFTSLYCVHNPGDADAFLDMRFRNADGSTGTQIAMSLPARATLVLESDSLEHQWTEAWATFDCRVALGGGVVGGVLMYDPVSGQLLASPFAPTPELAVTPPCCPLDDGWNMISIPRDAVDGTVESVLALPAQTNVIENALFSYSPVGGYAMYPTGVTTMRRGVGYWLYLDNSSHCEYPCAGDGGDFDISLDEGWTLWGYPHGVAQDWANCLITDGTDTYSPADAAAAGWIQLIVYGYDDGYYQVPTENAQVEPWKAYWLLAYETGLHLVVPEP